MKEVKKKTSKKALGNDTFTFWGEDYTFTETASFIIVTDKITSSEDSSKQGFITVIIHKSLEAKNLAERAAINKEWKHTLNRLAEKGLELYIKFSEEHVSTKDMIKAENNKLIIKINMYEQLSQVIKRLEII